MRPSWPVEAHAYTPRKARGPPPPPCSRDATPCVERARTSLPLTTLPPRRWLPASQSAKEGDLLTCRPDPDNDGWMIARNDSGEEGLVPEAYFKHIG